MSTDDLILAGFAAGSATTMVNAPFSDERYGIGRARETWRAAMPSTGS
ncbi:hypothetical protein [Actinomadura sp. 3N407]